MGTKYHRCGQAVWIYHKWTGKAWAIAFADLDAHKAIDLCPGCGARLEAHELTKAKPEAVGNE